MAAKKTNIDDEGIDLSDAPEVDLSGVRKGKSKHAGKRLELPLAGARAASGRTQVAVSEASGIDQGDISKLEAKGDLDAVEVGTLRRYVEALGGELELVAVMANGARIHLRGSLEGRSLGDNLKAAREQAGLTIDELSARTDVPRMLIHRYEKGEAEAPTSYCKKVWALGGMTPER